MWQLPCASSDAGEPPVETSPFSLRLSESLLAQEGGSPNPRRPCHPLCLCGCQGGALRSHALWSSVGRISLCTWSACHGRSGKQPYPHLGASDVISDGQPPFQSSLWTRQAGLGGLGSGQTPRAAQVTSSVMTEGCWSGLLCPGSSLVAHHHRFLVAPQFFS